MLEARVAEIEELRASTQQSGSAVAESEQRIGALQAETTRLQAEIDKREAIITRTRDVEHRADRVIAEVYDALNRTFVTPIDRSDIYALATALEIVTDGFQQPSR